ncbi:MAG: hypothetical protein R3F43_09725 [bacterium]
MKLAWKSSAPAWAWMPLTTASTSGASTGAATDAGAADAGRRTGRPGAGLGGARDHQQQAVHSDLSSRGAVLPPHGPTGNQPTRATDGRRGGAIPP